MESKFEFLKVAFSAPGRLSEDEEVELLKKYQNGDASAYNKLRLSLRPLVEKTISDAIPKNNPGIASNLRIVADTNLPKILDKYDLRRNVKLNTFIVSQLKLLLKNAVRENADGPYVPRNQHDDLNRYRQAIRDAQMEYGQSPSEEQIKSFYPEHEAIMPFDKIKQYHVNNLIGDATFGENEESDGLQFKDQFDHGDSIDDDDLMSSIEEEENHSLVSNHFNPTEQKVIELVTQKGEPFVKVALSLGMSTSEVKKIIKRWHDLTNKN